MNRSEIKEKVFELVSETLEMDAGELSESTTFDDLGADSFDLLELVTTFEEEFGLTMDDEALSDIATVGDVISAIVDAQ